jgi:hypothetical protein
MAITVQKQTAWAPWIKKLAEMLELHLAEVKHKGESKLWHPGSLAYRKLLYAMLHWANRRAVATASCWLQTCMGDIWQTKQVRTKCHMVIPTATHGINQHSPWADWPPPTKKSWTINKELKTNTQQKGQTLKAHQRRGKSKEMISVRTISKQMLERQEGQQQAVISCLK